MSFFEIICKTFASIFEQNGLFGVLKNETFEIICWFDNLSRIFIFCLFLSFRTRIMQSKIQRDKIHDPTKGKARLNVP